MSSIKKFHESLWKKFAETNKDSDSILATVDGKRTTIQDVLQKQSDDIESLKRNVSWLALHGGGGSGSGSSGTTSAKATVKVNSYSGGKQFAIINGTDLTIALENMYPKNSTTSWKVKITIGSYQTEALFSNSSNSTSIKYAKFADQLNSDKTTTVTVNATYTDDTNGIYGSESGNWYIYLATITIGTKINSYYALQSIQDDYENPPQITITGTTPIESELSCTTTLYDGGDSYTNDLGGSSDRSWSPYVKDLFGQSSTEGSISKKAGLFVLVISIKTKDGDKDIEKSYSTSLKITAEGIISLAVTGISKVKNSPTIFSDTSMHTTMQVEGYLDGGSGYTFTVWYKDNLLLSKTPYAYSSAGITHIYNPYIQFSKDLFSEVGKTYEISCIATDNVNSTIKGTSINYFQVAKTNNDYLQYDQSSLCSQMIGIYAHDLTQFSNIQNHIELTSNLPLASGQKTIAIDFVHINESSGVKEDDDHLPSLRIANSTNMIIDPTIGSVTLSGEFQWTIGITLRSDQYIEDDPIEFVYGYYDQKTKEIDGIVIKPHGVYLQTFDEEGNNYECKVKLTDNTPNIIHIVFSTGSSEDTRQWDTSSGNSFVKIYLNGVLTHISHDCPFRSTQGEGNLKTINNISNFRLYIGGVGKDDSQYGNINLYSLEVFRSKLNELGFIVSEANSKVMTNATYDSTGYNVDFSKQKEELSSNFCQKDDDYKISSLIYQCISDGSKDSSKFTFENLYNGDVQDENYNWQPPIDLDSWNMYKYQNDINSIPFPMLFIDVQDTKQWTFDNFTYAVDIPSQSPVYANPASGSTIWYWDPSKTTYAIKQSKNVLVEIQGTSTLKDHIKNLNITFEKSTESGTETLFAVNNNWIPENTYTLKADIVDSSHSNNASIGSFINDICGIDIDTSVTKGFDFDFNTKAVENVQGSKTILDSTIIDVDGNPLLNNINVKHTVEGFPVLVLVRFYGQEDQKFTPLGIYSFNLGRDAFRNIGFTKITGLTAVSQNSQLSTLPGVAKYYINETETTNSFWIEREKTGDITLSSIPDDTNTIPEDINTGKGSFWQSSDDILNNEFETRYSSTKDEEGNYPVPSQFTMFKNFRDVILKLPIEGTIHYNKGVVQDQIYGSYQKYKVESDIVPDVGQYETMTDSVDKTTIDYLKIDHTLKYLAIALLFGLRDNLDKNLSYRSWNNSPVFVDFYDLDTALGLTNQGLETQSPMMLFKYLTNQTDSQGIPIARESFNQNELDSSHKDLIILPESIGNKLLFSIDSNTIRSYKNSSISQLSYWWFQLRDKLDEIAKDKGYKNGFVDWFISDFFEKQTKACGSIFFNYDYKMKYVAAYGEDDTIDLTRITFTKCHGRRLTSIRQWLEEHLILMDSYFYWRAKASFGGTVSNINSHVSRCVTIAHGNNTTGNKYTQIMSKYNTIFEIIEDQDDLLAPTFLVQNKKMNIYCPTNGNAGSESGTAILNSMNTLISIDWNLMKTSKIELGSDLSSLYNLNSFTLNRTMVNGFFEQRFLYDDENISQIKSLDLHDYNGTSKTNLNIKPIDIGSGQTRNLFKNLNSIDISKANGVESLILADTPLKKLNVLSSNIQEIQFQDQPYISIPKLNGCKSLKHILINNCILNEDDMTSESLVDYTFLGYTNLQDIQITNCSTLKSITLSCCTNLTSINLDQCSSLTSISLISCESLEDENHVLITKNPDLQKIHIEGCEKLSSFTLDVDDDYIKNITSLEFGSSYIQQINRRYKVGDDDPIFEKMTDSGNSNLTGAAIPVLDIKDFTSASLTIGNNHSVQAIRFPNILSSPKILPYVWSWGTHSECSSLKRVYGHLVLNGNGFSETPCSLFNGESTGKLKSLTSYNQDKSVYENLGIQSWDMSKLSSNATFLSSSIGSYTLKYIESVNGKAFNEFDPGEWGRNYSIIGSGGGMFRSASSTSRKDIYYALFRMAMTNLFNTNRITSLENTFQGCYINQLTEYTFKGLSDVTNIDYIFNSGVVQTLSKEMLSCIPRITQYNRCFSGFPKLKTYDTLSYWTELTSLGINDGYGTENGFTISFDNESNNNKRKIFSKNTKLKDIEYFNLSSFDYGCLQLPSSVIRINNSFSKDYPYRSSIIDIPSIFSSQNNQITGIYNSFNGSGMKIFWRPSSFKNLSNIVNIGSNDSNGSYSSFNTSYKYIVKDTYEYTSGEGETIEKPFNADNASEYYNSSVKYSYEDMLNFEKEFLSSNTRLQTFNSVFRNCDILTYHSSDSEIYLSSFNFPGELFKKNTSLTSLQYGMTNFKHTISCTQNGFENCYNIEKLAYLFYQDFDSQYSGESIVKLNKGIASDLPYRLFYHGHTDVPVTISGTLEISSDRIPPVLKTLMSNIQTAEETTSFSSFKNSCLVTLLVDKITYDAMKLKMKKEESEWFNFPEEIDSLENSFQSITLLSTWIPEGEEKSITRRVVREGEVYQNIYNALSDVSSSCNTQRKIYDNLYSSVLGISSVNFTYMNFNTKITDLSNAFAGNGNIKKYTGETIPEVNKDFNPFKYVWNGNSWSTNTNVDPFRYDDSWSQNGLVLSDDEVTLAYNPEHKNTVDSTMSALSLKAGDTFMLKAYFDKNNQNVQTFKYNVNKSASVMNYMCAPDLLRYVKNNSASKIVQLFKNTSNGSYNIDIAESSSTSEAKRKTTELGMYGRIPPILFKTLSNINNLNEIFNGCKFISGYKTKNSDDEIVVKYIPDDLFRYFGTSLQFMVKMFYNNILPLTFFDEATLDLATPFQNLTSTNDYYKDISGIFGFCLWLNSTSKYNILKNMFNNIFIQKCNGAFSLRYVTGSYSGNNFIMSSEYYYQKNVENTRNYKGWMQKNQTITLGGKSVNISIGTKIGEKVFDPEINVRESAEYGVFADQEKDSTCTEFTDTFTSPYGYKIS